MPVDPSRLAESVRPRGRGYVCKLLTGAAVAAAAIGFVAPAQVADANVAAQADEQNSSERFLRFRKMPAGGVLETSVVTYRNLDGVTVDLIGAVHVGDEAYYDFLNEQFAKYDSLLYEMVKPKGTEVADRGRMRAQGEVPFSMQLLGSLQKAMQLALELDFQVEAIDYSPSNFVHADLDLETFMRLQEERGEGFLDMILKQMLNDLTNPRQTDYQPPNMLEIMAAMNAPDRARRLKLLFARELSRMDDLEAMLNPGGDGSVILDVRNEKAIEVMDQRIEAGDTNLGIFYGAAHLKGMDDLLRERGFEQVGEPDYVIAWDMTTDGSGQKDMRDRMRSTIVKNAVTGDRPAGEGDMDGETQSLLKALRTELDAIRRENEALRRQVEALEAQNEALRDRIEATQE